MKPPHIPPEPILGAALWAFIESANLAVEAWEDERWREWEAERWAEYERQRL